MLSDAVIQAIADQIQAGYTDASSTCVVYPYWPSPVGVPTAGVPGPVAPWLVVVEDVEYDEPVANGLRGTDTREDTLLCKYHLPGLNDQPTGATGRELMAQSRADKMLLSTMFTQGVAAAVGGVVIQAARKITITHPRGGPYDATVKTRSQYTWQALITVRPKLHL